MGFFEMVLLGIIALIFIGPQQLPGVARSVAKLLNELKRATGDITQSFYNVRDEADKYLQDTTKEVQDHLQIEDKNERDEFLAVEPDKKIDKPDGSGKDG